MSAPPPTWTIHPLTRETLAPWNDYVHRHPQATFFHLGEWQELLQRAFGHPGHFLYAEQGGRIGGVLPLAEIKSRWFGHALLSTPFCVYGGAVGDDPGAIHSLEEAALDLATRLQVDYLELRHRDPAPLPPAMIPGSPIHATFRQPLPTDARTILQSIPRKQRAEVRQGIACGLQGEIDRDPERCYRLYAESVHQLGTPVFSRRYFQLLREFFPHQSEILTITRQGRAVASVLSFYFRDEVLPYYGGGGSEARQYGANAFLYYELMRRSGERGVRWFDFGRSKVGSGAFAFKRHFGFTPEPLHYRYRLFTLARLPEKNPQNPRYRWMTRLWRLLPLPMASTLGPWIAGSLG